MLKITNIRLSLLALAGAFVLFGCSSVSRAVEDERIEFTRRIANEVDLRDRGQIERLLQVQEASTPGAGRISHPPGRRAYVPAFGEDSQVAITLFPATSNSRARANIQIQINSTSPNCLNSESVVRALGEPTHRSTTPAFIAGSIMFTLHYEKIFAKASEVTFSTRTAGCVEEITFAF